MDECFDYIVIKTSLETPFMLLFFFQETCPSWSPWPDIPQGFVEACSESCNEGLLRQTRQCRGGFPGEPGCDGSNARLVPCNTQVRKKIMQKGIFSHAF